MNVCRNIHIYDIACMPTISFSKMPELWLSQLLWRQQRSRMKFTVQSFGEHTASSCRNQKVAVIQILQLPDQDLKEGTRQEGRVEREFFVFY